MDRVLSVDLGTKGDYTAIVLLEVVPRRQEKGKPLHLHEDYTVINEIHCRFMERHGARDKVHRGGRASERDLSSPREPGEDIAYRR
jgi:hypothetical protein